VLATLYGRVISTPASSRVRWIVKPQHAVSKSFEKLERNMISAFQECSGHFASKDSRNVSWQLQKPDEFIRMLLNLFKKEKKKLGYELWSLIETIVMNVTQPEKTMRKKLCEWLHEVLVTSAVEHGKASEEAEQWCDAILWYLSCGEFGKSLHVARRIGDMGLACILSQLDGGKDVRGLVREELKHWKNRDNLDDDDNKQLHTVYCVLGGLFDEEHQYLSQLDWKAVLGLNVWFKCSPSATVSEILHAFRKTISLSNGSCSTCAQWQQKDGKHRKADTMFWLWKLASLCTKEQFDKDDDESEQKRMKYLERIVSQIDGHTDPGNKSLRGRGLLMAFFIMHVLRSKGFGISDNLLWTITVQLGDELEQAGMWKDALFVYLQAQTDNTCEPLCQPGALSVLTRCYPTASREEQQYVQNDLYVPSHWLALADAWYLQSCGKTWKALDCYIKGGMYAQAHQLLLDSVAFPVIVENKSVDIAYLVRILKMLRKNTQQSTKPTVTTSEDPQQPAEKRAKVDSEGRSKLAVNDQEAAMPGWDIGGGALLSFFEECSDERLEDEDNRTISLDIQTRKENLAALARALQKRSVELEKQERMMKGKSSFGDKLTIERAALGLMAERVARCLMRVHIANEGVLSLPAYQHLLQVLPLPSDVRNTIALDSAMEFVSTN